ncbi:MAG: flagellar basal body rod protein FlgB [SAR324 cluster bacterium]|nr:flagellar basal body rod protein FlgB [SAR324 cluster bacterium]
MAVQLFDRNLELLTKAMSLTQKRQALITSNIANRETPGYRAQDLMFEKALTRALHSDKPGTLKTTDPRHFDGIKREPLELVEGEQINSFNPDPRMDGNTVILDKEMAKLAQNQLQFQAQVRAINWKMKNLKSAITEGGR